MPPKILPFLGAVDDYVPPVIYAFGGSDQDLTTSIGLWSGVTLPLDPAANRVIIAAMGSSRTSSVATSHDDVKLGGVDMNRHAQIALDTGFGR